MTSSTQPLPKPLTTPTLVIAARGKTGRRVVDRLTALGHPVRAASRTGATAESRFDWNDRATWPAAVAGARAAYVVYTPDLAVPGSADAITAFCELAKEHGLERIVLLSGRGEPEAQRCEAIVQASGVPSTIVRASWFLQNFDEGEFAPLVHAGEIALPAGDVPEPFVDADDIADVVVAALTEDGHAGELYEVTGPRCLTFAQAVAELAEVLGRDLRYVQVPADAFRDGLAAAGMPAVQIALLDELFSVVLDGRNAHITDGVQRALGRPARDFRAWATAAMQRGAWDAAAPTA